MHDFIINASLQLLPIAQDKHPYEWVDEAIMVVQQSGIKFKIGPFATIVEGTYAEVMKVVHEVNEHLVKAGCNEWILSLQINMRSLEHMTANEKIQKFLM